MLRFICHLWQDSVDTSPETVVMTDVSEDTCHILEDMGQKIDLV